MINELEELDFLYEASDEAMRAWIIGFHSMEHVDDDGVR